MNISWNWLNELIDLQNTQPEQLANTLTFSGFEVENIIKESNNDTVLNISIPANRYDITSIIGITREISTLIKQPIRRINNQQHLNIKCYKIQSNCLDYHDFLYGHLNNITIQASPIWLQNKLKLYGYKSENNLTDIIKFISLKWGQHLEVFDLKSIDQNNTILRYQDKSTIITNNNIPISLTKIDSSLSNTINVNTSKIILQASTFNKQYIKITKNICSTDLLNAYSEAILLINYLCQGETKSIYYLNNPQIQFEPFIITEKYINNILGFISKAPNNQQKLNQNKTITKANIINILNHLNCIVYNNTKYLKIYIPFYRSINIIRNIDLIEEIGRIHGFNYLIDSLPHHSKLGNIRKEKYKINQIRYILRTLGLSEAIHYSLTKTNNLKIYNPLNEEHTNLRNNIISNLIEANLHNIKQGNYAIDIFEIGRVFNQLHNNYLENLHIAGLIGGKEEYRSAWSEKPKPLTWFQAKGDLEELFERLQVDIHWKKPKINDELYNQTKQFFHPHRLATLLIDQKPVGIFGQLDLKLCKKFNFSKNTYGFEIKLIDLMKSTGNNIYKFKYYSKYPYIIRDITISCPNMVEVQNLLTNIKINQSSLIESIKLFDYYTTKKSNQKITHLGFRIKYRSKVHTLTNGTVDIMNEETKNIIEKHIKK